MRESPIRLARTQQIVCGASQPGRAGRAGWAGGLAPGGGGASKSLSHRSDFLWLPCAGRTRRLKERKPPKPSAHPEGSRGLGGRGGGSLAGRGQQEEQRVASDSKGDAVMRRSTLLFASA